MTNNILTVETQLDEKSSCTDVVVRLNKEVVFNALRIERPEMRSYSSTFWNVDKDNSKEDYLRRLAVFYEAVRDSNFNERPSFEPYIYLTYGKLESDASFFVPEGKSKSFHDEVPLEHFFGTAPEIFRHPHFNDFTLLRVFTPYVDFTLEDYTGPWKPETGLITVISHNNLSTLLAGLMSETARTKVPANELEPILANNVYSFKR